MPQIKRSKKTLLSLLPPRLYWNIWHLLPRVILHRLQAHIVVGVNGLVYVDSVLTGIYQYLAHCKYLLNGGSISNKFIRPQFAAGGF